MLCKGRQADFVSATAALGVGWPGYTLREEKRFVSLFALGVEQGNSAREDLVRDHMEPKTVPL